MKHEPNANDEIWIKINCPDCHAINWVMVAAFKEFMDEQDPDYEGFVCHNCKKTIFDESESMALHGNWPIEKLLEVAKILKGLASPV